MKEEEFKEFFAGVARQEAEHLASAKRLDASLDEAKKHRQVKGSNVTEEKMREMMRELETERRLNSTCVFLMNALNKAREARII